MFLYMGFNEAQLSAVSHYKGPAMVLAGPGSGKTTVITHRIKNLIEQYKGEPSVILVITFTRMAAEEMKGRFLKLTDNKYPAVTFGTFHAIYFTILKHAYNYNATNIIRQSQQMEYIRSLMDDYELEIDNKEDFTSKILSEISMVKGGRRNIESYESVNCPPQVFKSIFRKYNEMLYKKRLIDFDDMMVYCYELFDKRSDVLAAWQNKYQYILIDEFQDISDIQFDVIRQLAAAQHNIFIVGDDDQSIYGFRGARPEIMMSFNDIYKEAVRVDMNINYRSTANIVNAAKSVIDTNKSRFYKDIKTVNDNGEKVVVNIFNDTEKECAFIVDEIKKLIHNEEYTDSGYCYKDVCVLSRTNSGAGLITQELVKASIPFASREKLQNIFEHRISKDIIAYIKLVQGADDRSLYLRIINKPLRYINRQAFTESHVDIERVKSYYTDKLWMQERIDNLILDIKLMKNMLPFAAINYIRKGVGYDDYIKAYCKENGADYDESERVLSELAQSAKEVRSYEEWFAYIKEYSDTTNNQNADERKNNDKSSQKDNGRIQPADAVNICTMHTSKGLEFKAVFVIDVNEDIIPYKKAVLDPEIEEERRMFYVAMTRAKTKLYLCCVKERYNKKMSISRFIQELDENYVQINDIT